MNRFLVELAKSDNQAKLALEENPPALMATDLEELKNEMNEVAAELSREYEENDGYEVSYNFKLVDPLKNIKIELLMQSMATKDLFSSGAEFDMMGDIDTRMYTVFFAKRDVEGQDVDEAIFKPSQPEEPSDLNE